MSKVIIRPVGQQGIPGEGVPIGGATGEILVKASGADYDTEWVDTVESVTGDGVDNTDPTNPVLSFPTPAEIGAIPTSEKGVANGVATLGADGRVVEESSFSHDYYDGTGLRGNFYHGTFGASGNTQLAANTLVLSRVFFDRAVTIDALQIQVTVQGSAGALIRLGVFKYQENTTTLDLIVDAGTALADTLGAKTVTFSPIDFEGGELLLGVIEENAPAVMPSLKGVSAFSHNGLISFRSMADTASVGSDSTTVTTRPFPSTILVSGKDSRQILIGVRVVP